MNEYLPYIIPLYLFIGFILGSLFTYFNNNTSAGPMGIAALTLLWVPIGIIAVPLFLLFWWTDKLEEWGQIHRLHRAERRWNKANERQ